MMVIIARSDSVPFQSYRVTVDDEGEEWHCDCPARVKCKHIRRSIAALESGIQLIYHEDHNAVI